MVKVARLAGPQASKVAGTAMVATASAIMAYARLETFCMNMGSFISLSLPSLCRVKLLWCITVIDVVLTVTVRFMTVGHE